ncbi:MAG: SPOCS domain-containing protein [Anaerocolumna sp.]
MELIKKNVHMNKLKCRSSLQLTLDDDFNVTDVKPDISQIIKEQGTIRINDVKMSNGKLIVKGVLSFNVLYLSEEDARPIHNMSGEIPFDELIHLDEACTGDEAIVSWELEDLTTGLINCRKLSVKAILCLKVHVEEMYDEATAVSVEGDDDVQFRTKRMYITDVAVDKKDIYRVKDQIHLPSGKGNISEILYNEVELRNTEARLLDNKFTIKGELLVFVLYDSESEDNPVEYLETEIPFSATIECNGCSEDMIDNITFQIANKSLELMPDADGEERIIDVEAVIEMGIKIYDEGELELLYDVYSPVKELIPSIKIAHYENLLVKNNSKIRVNDRIKTSTNQPEILQVCHASGDIKVDEVEVVENGLAVNGVLDVQILYICADDNKPLFSIKGVIPFNQVIEAKGIQASSIYRVKPSLEQLSVMMLDGEEIEVKASIGLGTIVFDSISEPIITDIASYDIDYDRIKKMPSMIGYIVKSNDTLWDIAKKYYSTVDRIMELNDLESEVVKSGDKLLIMKQMDKVI